MTDQDSAAMLREAQGFVRAAAMQLHYLHLHFKNAQNAPKTAQFDWDTDCQHPDCRLARTFSDPGWELSCKSK